MNETTALFAGMFIGTIVSLAGFWSGYSQAKKAYREIGRLEGQNEVFGSEILRIASEVLNLRSELLAFEQDARSRDTDPA